MATSKSTSGSAAKKPTPKKSTASQKTTTVVSTTVNKRTASIQDKLRVPQNVPAIILAEVIGTFALTLVALLTLQNLAPLYVGLTVVALVLSIGVVSGAHLNPAVTFGLWSVRKLKSALLPVYWVAQFVGAIIAVLILNNISSGGLVLDFSRFILPAGEEGFNLFNTVNWNIVTVEIIGTAIFLFGLVAVVSQKGISLISKAFGVGLSLVIGLLVAGSVFTAAQGGVDTSGASIADIDTIPQEYRVKGATLNPAVALAVTENTPNQLSGGNATADEDKFSRLTLEVIIGTLVGAALGANLYILVAYASRQQER